MRNKNPDKLLPTVVLLEVNEENLEAARTFVRKAWSERAREYGHEEPADISGSCKFTSMFCAAVFGGSMQGNYDHQFCVLKNGNMIDLNADCADVQRIIAKGRNPYEKDPVFRGNPDHMDSLKSIVPRVSVWVSDFTSMINKRNHMISDSDGLISEEEKAMSEYNLQLSIYNSEQADAVLRACTMACSLAQCEVKLEIHPEIERRLGELSESQRSSFTDGENFLAGKIKAAYETIIKSGKTAPDEIREKLESLTETVKNAKESGQGPWILTRDEAELLCSVLDTYSRIGIGQFRIDENPFLISVMFSDTPTDMSRNMVESVMLAYRVDVMPELIGAGHSYGIRSREICDESRLTYDVQQVVRYTLAWHKHREQGGTGPTYTTDFSNPWTTSEAEIPTAEMTLKNMASPSV